MTESIHPTRSSDFLSRLRDGELTAEERERFAAHRVECAECRAAVDEYERTLDAYRAAPIGPPPMDLSARILRKIRAQSPSRRPFGVRFGIDIRWVGVFVAALLVVLISAPVLLRRNAPAAVEARRDAISARLLTSDADTRDVGDARRERRPAAPPKSAPADRAAEAPPAAAANEAGDRAALSAGLAAQAKPEAPETAAAPAPAPPPPKLEAQASSRTLRRETASAAAPERADETAGAGSGDLKEVDRVLRLTVRAADAEGPTPAVLTTPSDDRLAPLRGGAYVLLVESSGRVFDVKPAPTPMPQSRGFAAPERKARDAAVPAASAADALREIRFAAGGRPRRLLVRID